MSIYLSVSYHELALPLSSLSWPTVGLSWYQTSLSLVVPSVLPLILLCFLNFVSCQIYREHEG